MKIHLINFGCYDRSLCYLSCNSHGLSLMLTLHANDTHFFFYQFNRQSTVYTILFCPQRFHGVYHLPNWWKTEKKNYKKLQESKCYWNTASFKLEQIVMSATDIHSNGTIVNWINSFKWIDRQLNQFIRNFICRSGIEYNSPFDFKYI